MGTMAKEIKKLRGRDTYLAVQEDMDRFMKAKGYQHSADNNTEFLKQLYYGVDRILQYVQEQDQKIEKLLSNLYELPATPRGSRNVKVRRHTPTPQQELAKALHLIENNRDHNGRITWRKVSDPKKLIFAYLRKAESEGIDIEKTMEVQEIPTYRRVFQYIVYNLGSWKDVVEEYKQAKGALH
jgi:hypothetical protein